jgi:glycosyltransferase involved in cell wall biosynthesis
MICILHGYLLEGSGSNLWTRAIAESLCRQGETVHLMAQENHPERYDFIAEARRYLPDGSVETWLRRESPYPGRCILHKPVLGDLLPVYVRDRYEEFPRVVPMIDLPDGEIEEYLERNVRALRRVVEENGVTAMHANHSVLMSVVAQRVGEATGVPFAVMPHGSALEFAVKRDPRFLRRAEETFAAARRILVIGDEMRERVRETLGQVEGLEAKFTELNLGVDTAQFEPVARESRPALVGRLREALAGLPRGRTAVQTEALRSALPPGATPEEMAAAFHEARRFDGKAPDADLERKLEAVDWERDLTLLFVGRLISTKGIHGVVVALPLLLRERPDMRLLVVGHGPLREPLEAMLLALERGDGATLRRIVESGRELEGTPEGEGGGTTLVEAAAFLDGLEARGEMEAYLAAAREHLRPDRVIFTGYLTHRELRFLFPCADAAVFPSVVREAGPLVFLEALASGVFPLGTYFGGMRASIDSVAEALPAGIAETMKLDAAAERTVTDIVRNVPAALALGEQHRKALARAVRERYDWSNVAARLARVLRSM